MCAVFSPLPGVCHPRLCASVCWSLAYSHVGQIANLPYHAATYSRRDKRPVTYWARKRLVTSHRSLVSKAWTWLDTGSGTGP